VVACCVLGINGVVNGIVVCGVVFGIVGLWVVVAGIHKYGLLLYFYCHTVHRYFIMRLHCSAAATCMH
jgi:hypothetical protein